MSLMSEELASLILPHDYFEIHLNGNGNTQIPSRNSKIYERLETYY